MPVFGGAKTVPINTYKLKFREWGFALVAIAGPLMNFLLALAFYLVGYWIGVIAPGNGTFYLAQNFWGQLFSAGITTNLGFMLFNIIPIPPLDGSRVLYALAPEAVKAFMRNLERYGFIVIYALIWIFGSALAVYFMNGEKGILTAFYWIIGIR
jgi:Zn-dependent protease